jgi:hypothetical protein
MTWQAPDRLQPQFHPGQLSNIRVKESFAS